MATKNFLKSALLLGCLLGGAHTTYAQVPNLRTSKIFRKPKTGSSSRPQVPGYRDYLTYTVSGTVLNIAYPDNSLPATVTVSGAESGFILYSATALREEPVDLHLEAGDYTLTVTLVDERTYEGALEITTGE